MQRHHEVELMQALDELYIRGATSILNEKLYCWFDASRLRKVVFQQIQEHWEDLMISYGYKSKQIPDLWVMRSEPYVVLTREPFKLSTSGEKDWERWEATGKASGGDGGDGGGRGKVAQKGLAVATDDWDEDEESGA